MNALEAALYRGRIGRRRFMQLALATGASLSAVCAMAQEGGDAAITQLYNAQNLRDSYAYIVVGSGSGGATVAGRRVNIPQSYLYPVLKQGNVTLLTVAEATTLIMEGTTCKGVNFVQDVQMKSARAPRVILAAGAINTPKMLVLSGIGPKAELDRIGVPVTVDLPGIGQNFQDHVLLAGCIWEYNEPLPPRNSLAGATFFWKSDSALDNPDMQPFQIEVPYATEVTGPSYAPPPGHGPCRPALSAPKAGAASTSRRTTRWPRPGRTRSSCRIPTISRRWSAASSSAARSAIPVR